MNPDTCEDRAKIGRFIDEGERMPEELLAKLEHDASLKRFYDLSIKISNELRVSSDRWVLQHRSSHDRPPASTWLTSSSVPSSSPLSSSQKRLGFSGPRKMAFGLSAAALLILGLGWLACAGLGSQAVPLVVTQENVESSKVTGQSSAPRMESPADKLDSISDGEIPMQPSGAPALVSQLQFEDYFYLTVASTLDTLQIVSETIADRAVCQPLQRTVDSAMQVENFSSRALGSEARSIDDMTRLDPKQAQLVREFLMTTDFLVETLPREATKSWMELSYSYNRSR